MILSHPTANQNVRQTALAFAEAGLLEEFWTGVHWRQGGILDRLAGSIPRVQDELRRRSFSSILMPFIRTVPLREWGRQAAIQLGWDGLARGEDAFFGVEAVYRSLDRRVARRLAGGLASKAVYAYDDGAHETFRAARARGLKCIYEHPIVYWRRVQELQREEAELQPEWASTLGALQDSTEKLARKDEELAMADVVVTASVFAKESLALAPGLTAPVHVIPYGTAPSEISDPREPTQKLRVLFVGSLSQAKGLSYLLAAVAGLGNNVEFTLIGRRVSAEVPTPALLGQYRWIPSLAHHELLKEMSRHDVLVLPSLHEGFGLVLTEAMGQGLVVITTPHTGGPDLVSDGEDGFIVPIRSAAAIEDRLAGLLREPDRLRAMQEAARRTALARTWEEYRRRLVRLAREVVDLAA